MRKYIHLQFVRYVLVGIGNTTFSYGIYAVLLFVGLDYRFASLLSLVLGIVFGFTTQGTLVFRNATPFAFVKFVVAWMLIYLFNIFIIGALMRAPMSAYLAGAIATIPVVLVSYFILKYLVFGRVSPSCSANPTK